MSLLIDEFKLDEFEKICRREVAADVARYINSEFITFLESSDSSSGRIIFDSLPNSIATSFIKEYTRYESQTVREFINQKCNLSWMILSNM